MFAYISHLQGPPKTGAGGREKSFFFYYNNIIQSQMFVFNLFYLFNICSMANGKQY